MKPAISLCMNHTPWRPERVEALRRMLLELVPLSRGVPFFLHDTDYRDEGRRDAEVPGNPKPRWVDFSLAQWRWSASQSVSHHLFMTDDLKLAPHFWELLEGMIAAAPRSILGLLSNHPSAPHLYVQGLSWYRTNAWVVGPCYVVPHEHMVRFLPWAESYRGAAAGMGWSDDSTLNEWITFHGPGEAWHPIPTIISHDRGLLSTWAHTGHGDDFSHERINWQQIHDELGPHSWENIRGAPMLRVGA